MSITFLIPSYNSKITIENTVKEIIQAIKNTKYSDYEILIMDDCSTDQSSIIFKELPHKYKNIKLHENLHNLGFCKNFLVGITHASKEFLMFVPSDNVIDNTQISKIINKINNNDMVIVNYSNQLRSRELSRFFISKIFTYAINIFFINRIKYFNGTNIYRMSVLKNIKILSNSFIFQSEIVLKMLGLTKKYTFCSVKLNYIKKHEKKNTSFFVLKNIKKNIYDFLKLIRRKII
tara:strand:+ start:3508 stop:4209 length:702 start_codon:yes stop_codon:yes gene_type:complete